MDTVNYEIMADGTIKYWTDKISGANHVSADSLLKDLEKLAGGETKREALPHTHAHQHHHHQQREKA